MPRSTSHNFFAIFFLQINSFTKSTVVGSDCTINLKKTSLASPNIKNWFICSQGKLHFSVGFCCSRRSHCFLNLAKMFYSVALANLALLILIVQNTLALSSRREEILDTKGKYHLIWENDFDNKTIEFTVIAQTLGYVGFGISPSGGMIGANLVMGGVYPNGTTYFKEYLSEGNEFPKVDPRQDWNLIQATQNETHTILKFFRDFDTCDENDLQIGNDTSNVIWAYGETDEIGYHEETRGNFALNLLDPPTPPIDVSNTEIWQISSDFEMPGDDTTYWCTMHKSPALGAKHHAIGFEAYLPTKEAKEHTHHLIVHECQKNPGAVESFEELMKSPGDHCYKAGKASKALQHCQSFMIVWATGGKRAMFPENVGIPISETQEDTYYMLQIHYNNPQRLKGIKFDAGAAIFYTGKLREFEATTLTIGHSVVNTHIIPPKTKEFMTVGHCSSECTQSAFPETGINVFNVMLHSHLGGRKMKLRHFRNGEELPWAAYDNNYNFNYQQNRPMREQVKILPGDQLAIECTYETTTRENVTIGGFATEEEMCQAFILYYPRTDVWICGSHFPLDQTLKEFGIGKMEFVQGSTDPKVTEPPQHAGKRFTNVLNEIDWTKEKVEDLQKKVRFSQHTFRCGHTKGVQTIGKPMNSNATVTYPKIKQQFAFPTSCHV